MDRAFIGDPRALFIYTSVLIMRKKVLLHCCCGPCSAYPLNVLKPDFEVIAFFSNSNIYPREEYNKRLSSFDKLCKVTGTEMIADSYAPALWSEAVRGLENEPERGERCRVCFYFRLKRTFGFAKTQNIKYITSTLTVAPQKDSGMVFEAGRGLAREYGLSFLELDFKKNNGYQKSRELAKEYHLYIQSYCGCEFSFNERAKRKKGNDKWEGK